MPGRSTSSAGPVSVTIYVNPRSQGNIPVLVDHTSEFDPTDPATGLVIHSLRFGAMNLVDGGGGATTSTVTRTVSWSTSRR